MAEKRKKARKPLKNARRHVVKLAEIALNELELNVSEWTRANADRLYRIWRGLQWLDDDQAHLRAGMDDLLEAWDRERDPEKLVTGLRELMKGGPAGQPDEDLDKELVAAGERGRRR
jgi:hypothetical protein